MLEGKDDPADTHFPEDWIGSTTRANNLGRENLKDEGISKIAVDENEHLLTELFELAPDQILGREHYRNHGAQTGFLLKFLDAAVTLHIQCHPTVAFAKEHLNSSAGKTEAYIILKTREDVKEPYIYMGFQSPPAVNAFRKAVLEQDVDFIGSCFEKIPVRRATFFSYPGVFLTQ